MTATGQDRIKLDDPTEGVHERCHEWVERAEGISIEDLPGFLRELGTQYEHDFGTKIYAVMAAMLAARFALETETGELSPNQSHVLLWNIIRDWLGVGDQPMQIMRYERMLWPEN